MRYAVLLVLVASILAPFVVAGPQMAQQQQAASASESQATKWTNADMKAALVRARDGDAGSQFWVGAAYEQGWLGTPDFREALKWFRTAAKHGSPDAQNALGQIYEDGEGVPQNYTAAARWYRRAAEHVRDVGGAGQGRNNLGLLYLHGLGVPKDYVQAHMWFSLARSRANLSYTKAQMTPAQIFRAEQMAAEWTSTHPKR